MNEAETRAEHIDPALKAAGWGVVDGSAVRREFRITEGRLQGGGGVRSKPEIADYVLVYRNTKLAVIEAKAWNKPHTEGVAQAKSYAGKLAIRHGYATNGQAIYGIDMETGAEGDLAAYPGPEALWQLEAGKRYVEADFNRIIEIRQREAFRVSKLMAMIDQREKTLVFCATQDHALAVRDLINQTKTSTDPHYCQRVTANDGALGEQHLREFQDNEKTIPTVLTTSQKLSTGVDARNVRNIVLLRPVNSMIEFKQIIGRGTRLYEGKDYFTIYDFVRAHQLFSDPEWDGEPVEPETRKPPPALAPGTAELPRPDYIAMPRLAKIKVRLADGKERSIQSMVATSFWGPDGKPLSAAQFMHSLFGALPDFFSDEAELRTIWSDPDTRKALLLGLADKGFSKAPLAEMQKIIEAEKSDLFDVLAYVAFATAPQTRARRAEQATVGAHLQFTGKQQAFVDFVLAQYVEQGVEELDTDKLSPLLKLRYRNAMADALSDLGSAAQIRQVFVGFQRYLYQG